MVEPIYNNFTNAFLQGQAAGRRLRQQKVQDSAFGKLATGDTQGGLAELTTVDPEAAYSLRGQQQTQDQYAARQKAAAAYNQGDLTGAKDAAASVGDFDALGAISKMGDPKREAARQSAETIAAIGIRLKSQPPETWGQTLLSLKPSLVKRGIDEASVDQAIAAIQANPQALDGIIGSALDLKQSIELYKADSNQEYRDAQIGLGQQRVDNQRYGMTHAKPKVFAPRGGGGGGGGGGGTSPALQAIEAEIQRRARLRAQGGQ